MSEPITGIETPVRLDYTVHPSRSLGIFLKALLERRILGGRCVPCDKIYVPLRGSCPACATPDMAHLDVAQTGTVTTFCVVNIPFEGHIIDPPYVCAAILLDGSDIPIFHLVGGLPAAEVRMGLRVSARWVPEEELAPTLASILYFEPSGEPDAAFEDYEGHL